MLGSVFMKNIAKVVGIVLVAIYSAYGGTPGSITGIIYDQKSGDQLIGVNVLVEGTSFGGTTDLNGRYLISNLGAGEYTLRVSYVGYATKTITGVKVTADETFKLNIEISEEMIQGEEVVVTVERVLDSEAGLLADRKNAATVRDGISAEIIRLSPASTSGDAVKRVTGVVIVDDKYVQVRGATDRYNSTSLNGVSMTSTDTDVDKKSFSFDLVPSSLIENTFVIKSATPDLPGDFSGGLVQINTLDIPQDEFLNLGFSPSYNSLSSTKGIRLPQSGGTDWLGFDNGNRSFPSGDLPLALAAERLPNNYASNNRRAPIDGSYQLSYGNRFLLGENQLGLIAALSYKGAFKNARFDESPTFVQGGMPQYVFAGSKSSFDVLWGGIIDLHYQFDRLHKIGFNNSYNQSATNSLVESQGTNIAGSAAQRRSIEWDQRSLYLSQLNGDHVLGGLGNMNIQWKAFVSSSKADQPDRKQVEYTQTSQGLFRLAENYRTWSNLSEKSRGFRLDGSYSLGDAKLKIGGASEFRERTFGIQAYSTLLPTVQTRPGVSNPNYAALVVLPMDSLFSPENYGQNKLSLVSSSFYNGQYNGTHRMNAYFAMVDVPFTVLNNDFRVAGGARLENSEHNVRSTDAATSSNAFANLHTNDILPSLNFTWLALPSTNLRLSAYQSVNRPEFRELAPVAYLDFNRDRNVSGNAALQRAYIHNYDARVEVFPGVGEVVAASYFYKTISNAIEEALRPNPDRYVQTWFNSANGENSGFELELRKSLAFVTPELSRLIVGVNYTRVNSEVEYTDARTDPQGNAIIDTRNRPMQGQAPWTVNGSLQFTEPFIGATIQLLYNTSGRRLASVGDDRDQDVYEEPRDVIDLAISSRLFDLLNVKFTIRDLQGKDLIYTSGGEKVFFSRQERGTSYGLGVSLSL